MEEAAATKDIITPEANPQEWAEEAQRVAPLLKLTWKNEFRDWRCGPWHWRYVFANLSTALAVSAGGGMRSEILHVFVHFFSHFFSAFLVLAHFL